MKRDEVNVSPASVSGHFQEIGYRLEAAGACDIVGEILDPDRRDRVDFDRASFQTVLPAHRDARLMPDANGARDRAGPDAIAQVFDEEHQPATSDTPCRSSSAAV
ncbi:MAG TPA: hypothetical protein VM733_19845 [Thermoanaerobaculia bacterium]|nr:hypothetical protein [Thermoanaerobaculia bacterium]